MVHLIGILTLGHPDIQMPDRLRWYAARAKPGQEQVALINLERQEFPTYFPQMTIERARKGKIVCEAEPLFPSYVLVQFALCTTSWRAINSTLGIIRLVSFGADGTPSSIRPGEVERLQEREKAGELFESEIVRMRRGDQVRVKYGHAVDQIGTVVRTRGERITFLMSLLGRQVRVIAPKHALELVCEPVAVR